VSARDEWTAGLRLVAAGINDSTLSTFSPFYAGLLDHMADHVARGGPTWALFEPVADDPPGNVHQIRVLGGVHRSVLEGNAPELEAYFPTVGGNADADAAWPYVRELFARRDPAVMDALSRPPQTNEVGRSTALVGGFLELAVQFGLPLRLRELGSSAGLNLRFDRYWYSHDGRTGYGRPDATVRFEGLWREGTPRFDAPLVIADRRGCDRDPIDATTDDGRLRLLSYVWPDQVERFELLRRALEIAREFPVSIDRADAVAWLPAQLRPSPGSTTVVFHSIVWQYLDDATRTAIQAAFAAAGSAASATAPVAWLRYEPSVDFGPPEVRLTTWPGGDERLLGTGGFHVGPVTWANTGSLPTNPSR
jgi:hypothetical protein